MTVADANGHTTAAAEILLPAHAKMIRDSAITLEVAAARGYRTARHRSELADVGFAPSQQLVPALLIPVHSVDGAIRLHQARPDRPRRDGKGKPIKYETPFRSDVVLDVPPTVRAKVLDARAPLWITEGIRKADAAASANLGCIGLTGVWNWCRGKDDAGRRLALPDWELVPLQGRRVYVVFDSDVVDKRSVRQALEALFDFLAERGAQPRIVYLPPGPDGEKVGLDDYLAAAHNERDLLELATPQLREIADTGGGNVSHAKRLVDQALSSGAEFFHTPAGDPYATVPIAGHRETMALESRLFRRWLGRILHDEGMVAPAATLTDAIARLEGEAIYAGPEHAVHIRVAGTDEVVYIDLADTAWRAIEVRSTGWKVVDEPPVKFRRTPAMRPLAEPTRGGTLDDLRAFINVPDDRWALLLGWAVVSLMPCGGYPLLVLHGEQGTAKSTTAKLLRALVDPAHPALRAEPDNINNLMLAASNNWVLAYDNLSKLNAQLSDALCRISTGGGHAVRALYTNAEEALFDAQRPLILTGIDALPRRPDLLERALLVELPRIPPEARQTDRALWASFETRRPRILGALLDGVASALANRATVQLSSLPRMAEFAELATAAETGLQLAPGAIMAAYDSNREDATSAALEASPLWPLLAEFADATPRKASELLDELERRADHGPRKPFGWPSAPHVLSSQLKRLAPSLREVGIEIQHGSAGRGNARAKTVTLKGRADISDPSDPSDPDPPESRISGSLGVAEPEAGSLAGRTGVAWGRLGSLGDAGRSPGNARLGSLGSLPADLPTEDKQ